ncbi:dimethylsulfonioproprionate lyase family protein [Granulosicoccus antarcticus]|uniref:Dimethlysulfonioproprionate lyase DddL n=1 Tax=Granulosicoccus antarcticus IMCC3135 TaxID=1192854 RepID=A0A2Z2NKD6_9GAMM|nr:dimethylsulfonioproprionate lyase family protein [Granulosicoccus antarcticus]ASJ70348.1 Putative dimethlysulfonioproprionate lyase DddL [Granulosicoccus antarcticus IMCC3135]
MHDRHPELQHFLHTLQAAIDDRSAAHSPARLTVQRIVDAMQATPGQRMSPEPVIQPCCSLLDGLVEDLSVPATEGSTQATDALAALIEHARSLASLAPQLSWFIRPGAERTGEPFLSGHANATLVGKGGLEERDDVWIGVSVMRPGVTYPEHRHLPEEVYVALTPGQWQQNSGEWHEPGIGGIVHNPPNALHSMRSGVSPLLATWCLWKGR